jgi:ElaB/YqjD/DUF883 family membrane-anchored ribosome-binding protein
MNKAKKLDELVACVEELLNQLPQDATPQIAALRDRVDVCIEQSWNAVAREAAEPRSRTRRAFDSARRFGRHPYAITVVLLAGLLLASRRRQPRSTIFS